MTLAEDIARIGWPVPLFRITEILRLAETAALRKHYGPGHALVDGRVLKLGDSLADLQFISEEDKLWR